jgi:hypothetical protein
MSLIDVAVIAFRGIIGAVFLLLSRCYAAVYWLFPPPQKSTDSKFYQVVMASKRDSEHFFCCRDCRTPGRNLATMALVLTMLLASAGCSARDDRSDEPRQGGFYGGVSGGMSRP